MFSILVGLNQEIATPATEKNRAFQNQLEKNKSLKFKPVIVDDEGKLIHRDSSGTKDPVVAGLLSQVVLPYDLQQYEGLDAGVLTSYCLKDLYTMNSKLAAMMDAIYKLEDSKLAMQEELQCSSVEKVSAPEFQMTQMVKEREESDAVAARMKSEIEKLRFELGEKKKEVVDVRELLGIREKELIDVMETVQYRDAELRELDTTIGSLTGECDGLREEVKVLKETEVLLQ